MKKINQVWIFADFKPITEHMIELIDQLNVTDVVIGIAAQSKWRPIASITSLAKMCDELTKIKVNTHFMAWMTRTIKYIDSSCEFLKILSYESNCKSIMLDLEHDWNSHKEYEIEVATSDVMNILDDRRSSCQFGVTGLARLDDSVKIFIPHCDYVIPQAYSVWKPGNKYNHWSHSKITNPGSLQISTYNRWSQYIAPKEIVMGLACYWLKRPGISETESMKTCIKITQELNIDKVAYWSLKHLKGEKKSKINRRKIIHDLGTDASFINIIKEVQTYLTNLKFDIGKTGPNHDGVDGIWGKKSIAALNEFRKKFEGLEVVTNVEETDQPSIVDLFKLQIYSKHIT